MKLQNQIQGMIEILARAISPAGLIAEKKELKPAPSPSITSLSRNSSFSKLPRAVTRLTQIRRE